MDVERERLREKAEIRFQGGREDDMMDDGELNCRLNLPASLFLVSG